MIYKFHKNNINKSQYLIIFLKNKILNSKMVKSYFSEFIHSKFE